MSWVEKRAIYISVTAAIWAGIGDVASESTGFAEHVNGKFEWNQTLCLPVSLATDVELQFKLRVKSQNGHIEESSKFLHINGFILQNCSDGSEMALKLSFQQVRYRVLQQLRCTN